MSKSKQINAHEILESLLTGTVLVATDGSIDFLNPAAENLLGISSRQARGRPLAEFFVAPEPLLQAVAQARHDMRAYVHRDLLPARAHRSDPQYLDCRVIPLSHNADSAVLIELNDAGARTRISREHALATQQDVSRAIVGQLAHEIKNPLGGLRGAAQLLERQLHSDEQREYTAVILREADRLSALMDKLSGPVGTPRLERTNIHELLDHVYRLVHAESGNGLRLVKDYDPSLPPVCVDRDECIQALLNLARNAAQAVGGDGRVVFRTRALDSSAGDLRRGPLNIQVEIQDDGPGVPEALAATLFYPLVTGRSDGSGLGLALAQALVKRQDGALDYKSRPGRTVFRILLPVVGAANRGDSS